MWPFRPPDDRPELGEMRTELDELKRRMKVIEREHDDLHAAYRRLRAHKAQEARDQPLKEAPAEEVPVTVKARLRQQAAALLRGPRTGNGE